jgi:hypothetical protein
VRRSFLNIKFMDALNLSCEQEGRFGFFAAWRQHLGRVYVGIMRCAQARAYDGKMSMIVRLGLTQFLTVTRRGASCGGGCKVPLCVCVSAPGGLRSRLETGSFVPRD